MKEDLFAELRTQSTCHARHTRTPKNRPLYVHCHYPDDYPHVVKFHSGITKQSAPFKNSGSNYCNLDTVSKCFFLV